MTQITQSQYQKLTQELRLTPQQILQSTILQLTTLALEARVNQELEQNPVLEVDDSDDNTPVESENEENNRAEDEGNLSWEDILPQNDDYRPKIEYDTSKKTTQYVQPSKLSLVDFLFDQIKYLNFTEREIQIAQQIIWNLDDKGYFNMPLENIAFITSASEQEVEKVLKQVQHLDPVGIAARDLRECLLIQLEDMKNVDDAKVLLKDHFDNFANRRFEKVMEILDWDKERILNAQEMILKLNPKPGVGLKSTDEDYIIPDLIVEKIGNDFIVEVNDAHIPELRINSTYVNMLGRSSSISQDTKLYIKKKVDLAKWFMQAVHQRRVTMIRVMKAIINRQREFFEGDGKTLKPMILKDVAEDIKMDISTISRVTNGKYAQLSSGIYELKYFFNEGMKDNSGEEVSTRIIKDKLKQIIDAENKHKPYSDDQLSNLLKSEGYPIARRTVAKYREQLKMPVARLRRNI